MKKSKVMASFRMLAMQLWSKCTLTAPFTTICSINGCYADILPALILEPPLLSMSKGFFSFSSQLETLKLVDLLLCVPQLLQYPTQLTLILRAVLRATDSFV